MLMVQAVLCGKVRYVMCLFHRPLSLETQRSQRVLYFSFAVERAAKEKFSAYANTESINEVCLCASIKIPKDADFCFPPSLPCHSFSDGRSAESKK
jgi:hypothetical protein